MGQYYPLIKRLFHSGNRSYRRIMSRAMYLTRRAITTWVLQGFWAWLWSVSRRNKRYKQRLICSCETAAPKKCNGNTCRSMGDICGWCRQSYPKEKLYQDSWKGFFCQTWSAFSIIVQLKTKLNRADVCVCGCNFFAEFCWWLSLFQFFSPLLLFWHRKSPSFRQSNIGRPGWPPKLLLAVPPTPIVPGASKTTRRTTW